MIILCYRFWLERNLRVMGNIEVLDVFEEESRFNLRVGNVIFKF